VQDNGSAATAMLGLAGFVLAGLVETEYASEVEQAIESEDVDDFCRGCEARAWLHDRRPTWVRDLPCAGRPVTLVWFKRVWRCVEPAFATSTWTESR
jgi:transposase